MNFWELDAQMVASMVSVEDENARRHLWVLYLLGQNRISKSEALEQLSSDPQAPSSSPRPTGVPVGSDTELFRSGPEYLYDNLRSEVQCLDCGVLVHLTSAHNAWHAMIGLELVQREEKAYADGWREAMESVSEGSGMSGPLTGASLASAPPVDQGQEAGPPVATCGARTTYADTLVECEKPHTHYGAHRVVLPDGRKFSWEPLPPAPLEETPAETPFRKVVDDLTGGCGCACHTGTGYRSSCVHCYSGGPGRSVVTTPGWHPAENCVDDECPLHPTEPAPGPETPPDHDCAVAEEQIAVLESQVARLRHALRTVVSVSGMGQCAELEQPRGRDAVRYAREVLDLTAADDAGTDARKPDRYVIEGEDY